MVLSSVVSDLANPPKTRSLRFTGTTFYKSVMPLAYAYDIDIIGRSKREVAAAFSKFAEEARNIGLAVNENKTKFLLSAKDSTIRNPVR